MIKNKSILAVFTCIISLILGIIFGDFFTHNALGISVPIYLGALILSVLTLKLLYKGVESFNFYDLLFIPYWLVSLGFAYHQSDTLLQLDLLILFLFFIPLVYLSYKPKVFKRFSYFNSSLAFLHNLVAGLTGLPTFLANLFGFNKLIKVGDRSVLKIAFSVLTGLLVTVPVLIVFGLLFASADYAFKDTFKNLDPSLSVGTILVMLFAIGAILYFFIGLIWAKLDDLVMEQKYDPDRNAGISAIIQVVFLSLLNLLFCSFIVVQFIYLFGDHDKIVDLGLTYSEYARKGFWELQAVSILSFIIMFVLIRFGVAKSRKAKVVTKSLISLFAISIFIIIVSALKRMDIYVDGYGLTELRFYTTAFMILEAALFAFLAVANIERRLMRYFSLYSLLAGFIALIILNATVPDRFIAKTNIERYENGKAIDITYLMELSSDSYLELEDQDFDVKDLYYCELAGKFDYMKDDTSSWKEYNYSKNKAFSRIKDLHEEFNEEKCDSIVISKAESILEKYSKALIDEDFDTARMYWGVDSSYEDLTGFIPEDIDILDYSYDISLNERYLYDNNGRPSSERYLSGLANVLRVEARLELQNDNALYYYDDDTICRSDSLGFDIVNGEIKIIKSPALPLYFKSEYSWDSNGNSISYLKGITFVASNCEIFD